MRKRESGKMSTLSVDPPRGLFRWHYLWYASAAIGVMFAAILLANLWFLNFIHVFSALLWTGIDLFMGFVLGPIAKGRRFRAPGDRTTAHPPHAFPHADGFDHCRHNRLVSGRGSRLHGTAVAAIRLGRGGVGAGDPYDHSGSRLSDPREPAGLP